MIQQAKSFESFGDLLQKATKGRGVRDEVSELLEQSSGARKDFNSARGFLGEKSFRLQPKPKSRTTKKLSVVEKVS